MPEVEARNREELDQVCSSCKGERETVEHFVVGYAKYEEERDRLVEFIIVIIG